MKYLLQNIFYIFKSNLRFDITIDLKRDYYFATSQEDKYDHD